MIDYMRNLDFILKDNESYFLPLFGYDEDGSFTMVDSVEINCEKTIAWYEQKGLVEDLTEKPIAQ